MGTSCGLERRPVGAMAPHIIGDERTRGTGATTGCSWRPCCGSCAPARPGAIFLRCSAVEQRLPALQPLEPEGGLVAHLRGDVGRPGLRIPDRRLHHRSRPPACGRGEKGGSEDQAIGRSRGGLSTKIHLAVRGLGCPVRFALTAGQKGDAPQADALIEDLPAEVVMADAAYDSDASATHRRQRRSRRHPQQSLARPQASRRQAPLREANLIECCFSKLKQFRRVATRFEKTARNFLAVVTLAAIVLWLR